MADLTQDQWKKQLATDADAVIIDVRTQQEVTMGMVPKALHIDIYRGKEFIDELDKLDRNKNYYVYCRSGNRSGQACSIMEQMGFKTAYNLMGGMLEWQGEIVVP
ncbi:MAG: rhodanese-like domain-containing protein [Mangrovimonas sp.]|nr:rhodanese-like domain-containing protein [Mangrovimonas sp.]